MPKPKLVTDESTVIRQLRERIINLERDREDAGRSQREREARLMKTLEDSEHRFGWILNTLEEAMLRIDYTMEHVSVKREATRSGIIIGPEVPAEHGTIAQFYVRERVEYIARKHQEVARAQADEVLRHAPAANDARPDIMDAKTAFDRDPGPADPTTH